MNNEYIIVNKTALLKMRKELKKEYANWDGRIYNSDYQKGQVDLIDAIISSQSTPLIPEIEKAFENGVDSLQDNLIQKLGLRYQINEVSFTTINSTRGNLEDYITNLKLDI